MQEGSLMYGVVLMMALSSGAEQPAWNDIAGEHVARYGDHGEKEYRCGGRRRGCYGCCGGGCYGSCYGGYGCCGGGCYGGRGYGCCGGGWGYGCYGGCYGGYRYGGWGNGGMSYGGGYYGYSPYSGTTYAGYAQFGAPIYSGGLASDYGYGVPIGQGDRRYYDESILNRERMGAPLAAGEAPATIVVRLPADAKLMVGGAPTSSTQGVRWFTSPPLQAGKDYQYTLKAEVMRDGKRVERTKEVTVRAGRSSEVTIDLPAASGPSR
jgi:uncharacterized protein (TIGR03000 family)